MERLPAIAAFANAVMQLAVIVAFALTLINPPPAEGAWRALYMLHSWPIPLLTVFVLLGLLAHPATKDVRRVVCTGAVLMTISAWILSMAAGTGRATLDGELEGDAFVFVILSVFPAFTLAGLGATLIGDRLLRGGDTPNGLTGLGALALLAGTLCYTAYPAVFIAMAAFAGWWAHLGVTLSLYKPPQAALS